MFQLISLPIFYDAKIAHHDSAGNNGIISKGDIQWRTAGSGILHKEYHEESYASEGDELHIAQISVNLPVAYKMSATNYQDLTSSTQTTIPLPEDAGGFTIIAGQYADYLGKAYTFSTMLVGNIHLKSGKSISLDIPNNFNASILVVSRSCITTPGQRVNTDHMILHENEGKKSPCNLLKIVHYYY